jgi:hypothetical protein
VIITHAHDDHTAQLEALLTLFYQRERAGETKKVHFYISEGVSRKFSGLTPLWDNKQLNRYVLKRPSGEDRQSFKLNKNTRLTVLPAYHEDVITTNTAVGLAFEFAQEEGEFKNASKIVFTSDSSLYPPKLDDHGKNRALWETYKDFLNPDLLVAHIGSITKNEFGDFSHRAEAPQYYVNHLGMMGTFTMLHRVNPVAAVISEFGSELKDIRVDLVKTLRRALHNLQRADEDVRSSDQRRTFIVPGDLNIVYNIETGQFLCHSDCDYVNHDELEFRQATDYEPQWDEDVQDYLPVKKRSTRTYLFRKKTDDCPPHKDNRSARQYCEKLCARDLPYHGKPGYSGQ